MSEPRTRAEHVAWCKARALDYLPRDPLQAFNSMVSDLAKHPETANHPAAALGMMLLMNGRLSEPDEMRKFILGFN
jgi:cytochrome c peroxidase